MAQSDNALFITGNVNSPKIQPTEIDYSQSCILQFIALDDSSTKILSGAGATPLLAAVDLDDPEYVPIIYNHTGDTVIAIRINSINNHVPTITRIANNGTHSPKDGDIYIYITRLSASLFQSVGGQHETSTSLGDMTLSLKEVA